VQRYTDFGSLQAILKKPVSNYSDGLSHNIGAAGYHHQIVGPGLFPRNGNSF
jgi:hypothetical protein